MTATYATAFSGNAGFVPSLESTGYLIVNFSRNPDRFPLNKYIAIKKVGKSVGYWTQIQPDEAARVVNVQDYMWEDGNDATLGPNMNAQYTFPEYRTARYRYPFSLGWKFVQQAQWPVVAAHAAIEASKMMTNRTIRVHNVLETGSNWSGNTATSTSLSGGQFSAATTSNPYIKNSILAATRVVNRATNGVVRLEDLILVVNPYLASVMALSDEIMNYMKSSPYSLPYAEGRNFVDQWGVPPYYAGVRIIVEDTVQVTSRKGATRTDQYVQSNSNAILLSRPDGIYGELGGPSFSTFGLLSFEEMTVETFDDAKNRRMEGRVVEDTAEVMLAPASGYLITSCA